MNYMTIVLSYEYICKNISLHFFHWYTNFVLLVQKPMLSERTRSTVLRRRIYFSFPRLRVVKDNSGSCTYLYFKIALLILMSTFHDLCEDTQFLQTSGTLGFARGVAWNDWYENSSVLVSIGNLTGTTAFGTAASYSTGITHNCFHKISRRKELEQPCWYRSQWWQVLKVQNIKECNLREHLALRVEGEKEMISLFIKKKKKKKKINRICWMILWEREEYAQNS